MIFDTRREIDRITNASEGCMMLCASVARNHASRCNSDSNLDLRFVQRGLFLIETIQQFQHLQRGMHSLLAVILVTNRCSENGHQSVAFDLIYGSAMAADCIEHQ